eukprot:4560964-Pleurochrysis_carterae.AAC.3
MDTHFGSTHARTWTRTSTVSASMVQMCVPVGVHAPCAQNAPARAHTHTIGRQAWAPDSDLVAQETPR